MTRRQMYQRGEDQNKQTGFWGMIKSVTATQTGSESILYILSMIVKKFFILLFPDSDVQIICSICSKALTSSLETSL